jgi:hypothetical protein
MGQGDSICKHWALASQTCHNVLFSESFLASLDVPLTLLARD